MLCSVFLLPTYLPLLALHGLVKAAGVVAGNEPHELVEENGGGEKRTAGGGAQHPQHGEEDGDGQHREDLQPGANHRRKQPEKQKQH